jgi:glycosyltransferase involved in cell wall biosynthesis
MDDKSKILILSDFYLPGYKSGGAARSVANMIERLRDEFEFTVVTRNHDGWGDYTPYREIKTGAWNLIEKEKVFYFGKNGLKMRQLTEIFAEVNPAAIYAVSFFSDLTTKALLLRKFGRFPQIPFILAPQGELSENALRLKAIKKRTFLKLTKRLGIYKNVIWQASAEVEKVEISRVVGDCEKIEVAPDLTPKTIYENFSPDVKPAKTPGAAQFIFLSRINRKKNLLFALKLLGKAVAGDVALDIYGEADDAKYLRECRNLAAQMPPNVRIRFCGAVENSKAAHTFGKYHFFLFPTLSENFGHVIIESLAAGTPILLSDNTPWENLETRCAGWNAPLDDQEKWLKILKNAVAMTQEEFTKYSNAARAFAVECLAARDLEEQNREILRRAVRAKL